MKRFGVFGNDGLLKLRVMVALALVAFAVVVAYAADTWNEATPASTESPSLGDDRIRELKRAIRERLAVDHDFESTESTPYGDSGSTIGKHKTVTMIEQASDPTTEEDEMVWFTKEVSGVTELFLIPEDGATPVQVTTDGGTKILNSILEGIGGNDSGDPLTTDGAQDVSGKEFDQDIIIKTSNPLVTPDSSSKILLLRSGAGGAAVALYGASEGTLPNTLWLSPDGSNWRFGLTNTLCTLYVPINFSNGWRIGGTAVNTTAAEINTLYGQGVTAADFAKLHAIGASDSEIDSRCDGIPASSSASNASAVTVTGSATTIATISVGTVTAGDYFDVSSRVTTATPSAADEYFYYLTMSGTATVTSISGAAFDSTWSRNVIYIDRSSGESLYLSSTEAFIVTGAGTCTAELKAFRNSGSGTVSISAGYGRIGYIFRKKQ